MKVLQNSEARTYHDLDAGILLAATLSSKRRPAELVEIVAAAIRAYKATKKSGKNMLMPKPTVIRHFKVEGRWRRAAKAS